MSSPHDSSAQVSDSQADNSASSSLESEQEKYNRLVNERTSLAPKIDLQALEESLQVVHNQPGQGSPFNPSNTALVVMRLIPTTYRPHVDTPSRVSYRQCPPTD